MHKMIKIVAFAGLLLIVDLFGIVFNPLGLSMVPRDVGVIFLWAMISLIMGIILPLESTVLAVTLFWLSAVTVNLYTWALGSPMEVVEITAISAVILVFSVLVHVGKCMFRGYP